MSYRKKAEMLIASHRSQTVWGNCDDEGAAIQNAINAVFPYSPEWARAELYCRLMERWSEYSSGVPRRIFVVSVVREWAYWYARTPAPSAPAELVPEDVKVVVATDDSLGADETFTAVAAQIDGTTTVLDIIKGNPDE